MPRPCFELQASWSCIPPAWFAHSPGFAEHHLGCAHLFLRGLCQLFCISASQAQLLPQFVHPPGWHHPHPHQSAPPFCSRPTLRPLAVPTAYGKVFLVRKAGGHDAGKLYAMKVLRKAALVQRAKTQEHTRTERSVLELVRQAPFLVTLHYAFQTDAKLHLILGKGRHLPTLGAVKVGGAVQWEAACQPPFHCSDYVNGGEMFTHLYQRQHFKEAEVRVYGGEIVLALEHLHKVGEDLATWLLKWGLSLGLIRGLQTWQPRGLSP